MASSLDRNARPRTAIAVSLPLAAYRTDVSGCDDPGTGTSLLPVDMAVEQGMRLATPLVEAEFLPLSQAIGRVLDTAITADFPQPLFDNSAMDGYAIRLAELSGPGPWTLPVTGRIAAGAYAHNEAASGASRIFTGARVPPAFDAVIMQEHVERDGDTILVHKRPMPDENIRCKGEDIHTGDTLLASGIDLTAPRIALAASTGAKGLSVKRKVRVAFFSTGTELRQPGEPLGPGEIYNSNRYLLHALLTSPKIDALDYGTAPDDPLVLAETLSEAAKRVDVVISTGGVSVGEEDHMPRVLKDVGGDLHVMKIAMKPGKPVTIGTIGKAVYVGLPGNPVASYVTFLLIAKPIIDKIAGLAKSPDRAVPVQVNFGRRRRPARREYVPVEIEHCPDGGAFRLTLLGRGGSAALSPIAQADGLAIIEPGNDAVEPGDPVPYLAMGSF